METLVVAVGRAGVGPEQALFQHYAARLRPPLALREVEEKRPLPPLERRAKEAELLLSAVPRDAKIVALDERGAQIDSRAFAGWLGQWRDQGVPAVAFLIGGADGFDDRVRRRAERLLAFGATTWPHLLARALLAEQLYRAQCILGGHPYHRG